MAAERRKRIVGVSDRSIRAALKPKLLSEQQHDDTVLLEELGLCRGLVRADIAVVNGVLHGYEIKSDLDSLHRLQNQADVYSKILDYATLVVGNRLLEDAVKVIPEWWGVLHAQLGADGLEFRTIRDARENSGRDPRALAELLWFEEAIGLLENSDVAQGVRGKPRRVLWDRISERLQVEEIATAVRAALKTRARGEVVQPLSRCGASYQGVSTLLPNRTLERHLRRT
jgi:hypothetical protein